MKRAVLLLLPLLLLPLLLTPLTVAAQENRTQSQTAPNVALQQKSKSAQSEKPVKLRPTIPSSMVGYVDNAVVGSQILIRFDAGFHDNAPDRAEFFYAQYAGTGGPGPAPVIQDLNFQQLYMHGEYAPTKRFSFFAEVPVRWLQPVVQIPPPNTAGLPNEAGISDVAAGFKLAAIASADRYLTFQFQSHFPSGDARSGLGTNHFSAEPALLYYQRLSDRTALEAQIGDSHPIGGSFCPQPCNSSNAMATSRPNAFAGDVFFYGVGPSYVVYQGEKIRIAPAVELVGWRVLGGLETIQPNPKIDFQEALSADGTNIVNLKVGARTMVDAHNSFYVGFGHQLTHAVWYKEIVRAEYRYNF
jgi:hypothetical protein